MTLPPLLEVRIREAYEALRDHPQHNLEPGYRSVIYAVFGPFSKPIGHDTGLFTPPPTDLSGVRRRTRLSILAAHRVLPVWSQRFKDDLPNRCLKVARGILRGSVSESVAKEVRNDTWDRLDDLAGEPSPQEQTFQIHVSAGFSAYAALATAIWDVDFAPDHITYDTKETDLDPWVADAAHWALLAEAGFIWEQQFDTAKSLAFWQWWLDKAVPAAYLSVPE